jgi:hypothetical protein
MVFGYLNDKTTRGIRPDPDRGPFIRKAFELYATGTYTLDRLTADMQDLGLITRYGSPVRRCQFHRILQNPVYCGIIRRNGEDHEGKHTPIVPKKLFDAVQAVMATKAKPKPDGVKKYLYRGLF